MKRFLSTQAARLQSRSFDDLFLVSNWSGQLTLIIVGLFVSFLLFGFWWPYWRVADMDLWMAYEGFLFNDGLPQEYFDHPGYLIILLIGNWFRLLHSVGLLEVHALSALPPPADAQEAWTQAIRAGRVLSLLLAISFVIAFSMLLRRLVGDGRIALLAAFAVTFSGGFAMQARIMRTELLAAGFVALALLLLLIAAREPRNSWRPLIVGLAAFLAMLGYINKVQAIFLIATLPPILLAFGRRPDAAGGFWRAHAFAWPAAILIAALAALAVFYVSPLIMLGLSSSGFEIFRWKPLPLGFSGLYQTILVAWFLLAMVAFATIWRTPPAEAFAAIAAAIGGAALGLLALKLRYHPKDVFVVLNPLEQMLDFAVTTKADCFGLLNPGWGCSLIEGFVNVIARHTWILQSSSRPTIFLQWLVIALAVVAWRRGEKQLAGGVAVMLLAVWGLDTLGMSRGLKMEYFFFGDPIVVMAAALLLASLPDLQRHRWVFPIGIAFFASHILVGLSPAVKFTLTQRSPSQEFCKPHFYYTRQVASFPYCQEARGTAPPAAR